MPPTLEGKVLTTGPPGKSSFCSPLFKDEGIEAYKVE